MQFSIPVSVSTGMDFLFMPLLHSLPPFHYHCREKLKLAFCDASYFFNPPIAMLLRRPALPALQAQYYFDKLTEENGLSDNRVTCFLKDKAGFLWIGTKNGLNRYDGNSFTVFKPGKGNTISSEEINDVVQDATGRIWVATMSGLNSYDAETNR